MSSVLHVLISIPGEHLCGTVQCAAGYMDLKGLSW